MRMTVKDMIAKLAAFNQNAHIVVATSDDGDNVQMWKIKDVHDGWYSGEPGTAVCIEINLCSETLDKI